MYHFCNILVNEQVPKSGGSRGSIYTYIYIYICKYAYILYVYICINISIYIHAHIYICRYKLVCKSLLYAYTYMLRQQHQQHASFTPDEKFECFGYLLMGA
jgi:hypothetical protein